MDLPISTFDFESIQMVDMKNNEYINADEASELLGITKGYLYKLTSLRKIPFYKPYGKVLLFKRSEIEAHIEKTRVASCSDKGRP